MCSINTRRGYVDDGEEEYGGAGRLAVIVLFL
jgi:hypothetical protein